MNTRADEKGSSMRCDAMRCEEMISEPDYRGKWRKETLRVRSDIRVLVSSSNFDKRRQMVTCLLYTSDAADE